MKRERTERPSPVTTVTLCVYRADGSRSQVEYHWPSERFGHHFDHNAAKRALGHLILKRLSRELDK